MKTLFTFLSSLRYCNTLFERRDTMEKKNYYCEHKFHTIQLLTSGTCSFYSDGSNKERHKLYEGSEKTKYICKYCGKLFPSIQLMAGSQCVNHPKGTNKGNHVPAL